MIPVIELADTSPVMREIARQYAEGGPPDHDALWAAAGEPAGKGPDPAGARARYNVSPEFSPDDAEWFALFRYGQDLCPVATEVVFWGTKRIELDDVKEQAAVLGPWAEERVVCEEQRRIALEAAARGYRDPGSFGSDEE